MIPKNPGIAQKGTQNPGAPPKKVPKIMSHPLIKTYASYLLSRILEIRSCERAFRGILTHSFDIN